MTGPSWKWVEDKLAAQSDYNIGDMFHALYRSQQRSEARQKPSRSASVQQHAGAYSPDSSPERSATAAATNFEFPAPAPQMPASRDPGYRKPVPQRCATAAGQSQHGHLRRKPVPQRSPTVAAQTALSKRPPKPKPTICIPSNNEPIPRPLATAGVNTPPRDPSWWDPAHYAATPGKKFPREPKPQAAVTASAAYDTNVPGMAAAVDNPACYHPSPLPVVSLEEARARKDIYLRGFELPIHSTSCDTINGRKNSTNSPRKRCFCDRLQ